MTSSLDIEHLTYKLSKSQQRLSTRGRKCILNASKKDILFNKIALRL